MTAGIVSYGAYIPIYRLSQAELAKVWGGRERPGEKAVANVDEDSITMAVEAALDCIGNMDRNLIDRVYFASTTAPYTEKQNASLVAAALDLRNDIMTLDSANSLRGGTIALQAALDAVNAGSAKKVLVVASDCRVPPPDSAFESVLGDGAAAFLIGDSDIIAEIEGSYMTSSENLSVWRRRSDTYVQTWEDRFIKEAIYTPQLEDAVSGLLKKYNVNLADFAKVAFYGSNAREHVASARALKLDKTQVQNPLFDKVGNTGSAFVPMMLVGALEEAKPGDKILTVNFSDGADAYALKTTAGIEGAKDKRGIKRHLDSKLMLPNYGRYIHYRDLMEWEVNRMHPLEGSLNIIWRESKAIIRGNGTRCRKCGHVQLPPQRICMWCQAKDEFDYVRVSDKQGELFTYSIDERGAGVIDLPNVLSVINLDGGGRYYGQMTDKVLDKLGVGIRMEFTFRKFHEQGGFVNYFWKSRPIRC